MNGIIKVYKQDKGYGFISYETGGEYKEIFFHISNVVDQRDDLKRGDRVSFEIGAGRKGPEAIRVQYLEVVNG